MKTTDKSNNDMESIKYGTRPKLLFTGNGINRCFDGNSWENVINTYNVNKNITYDEIKILPFSLQIVLATQDNVHETMKKIAQNMTEFEYSPEETEMYNSLLSLPFGDIITTNYTYELENILSGKYKGTTRNRWLKFTKTMTKDKNDDKTNWLYRYSDVCNKRIWHIHGELSKPSHMIMGHYYYNKLSACIQSYIPELIRRYSYSKNSKAEFKPLSWVDLFMLSDVYMLGFGMDMSEADIWYLVCCKKRNFSDTNIFFYTPERNDHKALPKANKMLMESYGIKIIQDNIPDDNYKEYYKKCINKLSKINF